MVNNSRPIGVFDSGLGGLTVVKEIKKKFPKQQIIYLGDSARVPYGTRSWRIVTQFALDDVKFLSQFDIRGIVIACNTVSALAIEAVRQIYHGPVWDAVSAGAAGAIKATKNKRIGIIATRGTVNSHAYKKALDGYEVWEQASPLFVPFIEEGITDGKLINLLAKEYLGFFEDKDIDTLVLGCTHYPMLAEVIQNEMGEKVKLVNCGEELADEINAGEDGTKEDRYFVTDLTERYQAMANRIMEKDVKISVTQL